MKNLMTILSVIFLGMFLVAGSAMALPTSLFEITNIPGTEGYTDTGVEAVALNHTGSSDAPDATAFLIFEFAGWKANNSFGIYDYTVEADGSITVGKMLEVFDGPDSPIYSVTLQWDQSLTTVTNAFTKESAVIDDTFGFYMKNTVNNDGAGVLWYSHSSLNDGEDHVMLFDTRDNSVGNLLGSDIVLAWDDQPASYSDFDYNDMVVGLSDVSPAPVPEPATMLLLGTGLFGLAGISRKKLFKK